MQPARHDAPGFPLAATLLVLSILGILVHITNCLTGSSIDIHPVKAQADVDCIAAAVRRFANVHGRVPSLEELTAPDAHGQTFIEELCEDPWGNAYEIEGMTVTRFDVISAGPDGEFDTDDDVRSRRGERR